VIQATLLCDLILYFWISISWSPVELQISTWLDLLFWRYCHYKILLFWLENAYSGLFLAVFGDFWPMKLWYRCSNPQRNAIFLETRVWDITRQNRWSGLTPSCAKVQIKKHRPLTFHPFVGVTPWTDRHAIWGTEWRPRHNHPSQILCQSVKGFLRGSTSNSTISYTFSNDPYNSSALPCRLWYTVWVKKVAPPPKKKTFCNIFS